MIDNQLIQTDVIRGDTIELHDDYDYEIAEDCRCCGQETYINFWIPRKQGHKVVNVYEYGFKHKLITIIYNNHECEIDIESIKFSIYHRPINDPRRYDKSLLDLLGEI